MSWPVTVTIVEDRYTGTYSGGEWLAYYGGTDRIDAGADGDLIDAFGCDPDCAGFFATPRAEEIGRGDTPEEALTDLLRRQGRRSS